MKKTILLAILAALLLILSACGGTPAAETAVENEVIPQGTESAAVAEGLPETALPEETSEPEAEAEEAAETESGSTILVLYFSRTGEQYGVGVIDKGNTAIVAEMIADGTGADLYEVLPADDHYPMTYDELIDVGKQEQNENARPEYAGELPDLSQYDTIFIGAPVWWGDWPMIMYTVFENNDLSGKTLIPFCTHAGSGLSGFDRKLASACPDSEVSDGLAIAGTDAQNDPDGVRDKVNDWLSGLGFESK